MAQIHRKSGDPLDLRADEVETAEGARSQRDRQMAEFSIAYDGRHFRYNGYRYEKLGDAIAYASLMRSRPARHDPGGPSTQAATFTPPTDDERTLMATLGIGFADGTYRFGDFRYERLGDAVNYARLSRRRQETEYR